MPVTPLRESDPVRVGPHRLLGRLGQGGMGTVFLGVAPDERAVAVKVLRDGLADPEARRRFGHELSALRRVSGPHLVAVLDADVDADLPYLVTRFVPGTRLDDLVHRTGPLSGDALRTLARGLAEALTTLHTAGVVHRDLTPGNVLMLDGEPQVIDLGLAVAADVTAMTRSGLVLGTPGYLAPEQVTGSVVTPAIDVHAWGATVAFAATGVPPYGTGRPEAVLYRIVHGAPELAGVPDPLHRLVAAAMQADPALRPTAGALLAELGGRSDYEPATVLLRRDVDTTTVLGGATALTAAGATALLTVRSPEPGSTDDGDPPRWDDPVWDDGPVRDDDGTDELAVDGRAIAERATDDAQALWGTDDDALAPLPARTHPARAVQAALTAVAALALLAAVTLVLPVVGALATVVLVVGLRAAGRSSAGLRDRRDRRGVRRRDPAVATLTAPWHLLLALVDTLTSVPLIVLVAGGPAAAVWFADPVVSGLERTELTVATACVVGLCVALSRRVHARSRLLLRRTLLTVTPGASSAVALLLALVLIAALLVATAEGRAPVYWPATLLP